MAFPFVFSISVFRPNVSHGFYNHRNRLRKEKAEIMNMCEAIIPYSYGHLPVITANKTPFIECIIFPVITSYNHTQRIHVWYIYLQNWVIFW